MWDEQFDDLWGDLFRGSATDQIENLIIQYSDHWQVSLQDAIKVVLYCVLNGE